MNSSVIIDLP